MIEVDLSSFLASWYAWILASLLTLTVCATRLARAYREWAETKLIKKSNAIPSGYRSEKEYSRPGEAEAGGLLPDELVEGIRPMEEWEEGEVRK